MNALWNKTKPWLWWLLRRVGMVAAFLLEMFVAASIGVGAIIIFAFLVAVMGGKVHLPQPSNMPHDGYYVHEGKVYELRDREWSELGPAECSKQ